MSTRARVDNAWKQNDSLVLELVAVALEDLVAVLEAVLVLVALEEADEVAAELDVDDDVELEVEERVTAVVVPGKSADGGRCEGGW
jgi:hypothetical protein